MKLRMIVAGLVISVAHFLAATPETCYAVGIYRTDNDSLTASATADANPGPASGGGTTNDSSGTAALASRTATAGNAVANTEADAHLNSSPGDPTIDGEANVSVDISGSDAAFYLLYGTGVGESGDHTFQILDGEGAVTLYGQIQFVGDISTSSGSGRMEYDGPGGHLIAESDMTGIWHVYGTLIDEGIMYSIDDYFGQSFTVSYPWSNSANVGDTFGVYYRSNGFFGYAPGYVDSFVGWDVSVTQ